jgi:hypothetical protein
VNRSAPPITVEGMGISPGSGWLATPEQVAEAERLEAEHLEQRLGELHQMLDRPCRCCGQSEGNPIDGLCPSCGIVVYALEAERVAAERIRGRSRREWAERYLDRQDAERRSA